MLKVTWREDALDEVAHIIRYTKADWGNSQSKKLVEVFERAQNVIASSPKFGKRVRRKNVYVYILSKVPFVFLYEFEDEEIFINQVIHTSKRR
jgi:plasmid stabilization system protein ParE